MRSIPNFTTYNNIISTDKLSLKDKIISNLFWNRFNKVSFFNKIGLESLSVSTDQTIVLDIYNPARLWHITKCSLHKPLKLWFWNSLKPTLKYHNIETTVKTIKDYGFEIFTFDPDDATKYDLKYKNQFGVKYEHSSNLSEYDIYFCGNPKGRMGIISRIESICKSYDLKTKIIVPNRYNNSISYNDNLANLSNSKCILDIVQKDQVGLSLRPIEALLNRKKLITNNTSIINYDFYSPNNIFILGYDNLKDIKDFINSPGEKISHEIIDKYEFKNWINRW